MQVFRLEGPHAVPNEPRDVAKAMERIMLAVAKSKRSIILVGAGISTSAGIPVSVMLLSVLITESDLLTPH
jgi:hypothetical protein